jgi:hypothetical protein
MVQQIASLEGKSVAVLGRYSFRETGRWVGEQVCEAAEPDSKPGGASSSRPIVPVLWLVEDSKDGPRPPAAFELDGAAVRKKFALVLRHTSLGKFRFGTPDYDRWAVIYGRIEPRKAEDGKAVANLVFRGNGVIVFLTPD